MRGFVRISLVLLVGLVAGACFHRFHDDDDVTVELERLAPFQGGCIVRGTVRNDDDHTVRVFFTWRALDRDDDVIGTAEAEVPDVPRDGRRDFESTRFREFDRDLIPCGRIARVKRSAIVTRD
jgi:hypothetical protein